jgi:hypothetical protein
VAGAIKYQADMKALKEAELQLSTNKLRPVTPQVSQTVINNTTKKLEAKIGYLKNVMWKKEHLKPGP